MRRARILLLVLAAPVIVYLGGANLVLQSGLAEHWINRHPERVEVHWRVGWTIWPGTVHLRGFRLVSSDDHVQMELVIDRATVDVEPWPATERWFQADRVIADGVDYRLRSRPRDHRARLRLSAVQPPIDGLENTIVRRHPKRTAADAAASPSPGASAVAARRRTGRRPWSIHLSGIEVHGVRQIWIGEHRLEGTIAAGGAFLLQPHRRVWVDARLTVADGTLTLGTRRELESLTATLTAKLHGFDPRRARGLRALRFLEASVDAAGRMRDASFARYYLGKAPWLSLAGGEGPIAGQVSIARGHVVPGSHVEARARNLRARFLGDEAVGSGRLTLSAGDGGSRLVATLTRFVVLDPADHAAYMRGRHLTITATRGGLSLTDPFAHDLDVAIAVPEAAIPDFAYYQRYIPASAGLTLTGGSGTVNGNLSWSSATGRAKGKLALSAHDVSARWDDLTLSGAFALHTIVPSSDAALRNLDVSGTSIALDDVAVTGKGAPRAAGGGWWGRAVVVDGTVSPGATQWLSARVSASLRDSTPLVALFSRRRALPRPALEALSVSGLAADVTVRVAGNRVVLAPLTVSAPDLDLRMDLAMSQGRRDGALYVKRGPFSTALELDGDETKVHLIHPKDWFAGRDRSVYARPQP